MEDDINKTIVVPHKGVTMGPEGPVKKDIQKMDQGIPEFKDLKGDALRVAQWIWKLTSKIKTPDGLARTPEAIEVAALIGRSGVSEGFKVILSRIMSIAMKTEVGTDKGDILPQIPKGIMVVPFDNTNGSNYATGEPTLITVRNTSNSVSGMRYPDGRQGDSLLSIGAEIRPATPAEIVKFVTKVGSDKITEVMGLVII